MELSIKKQNQVLEIMIKTIKDEPTNWNLIVEAIRKDVFIKSWLDVREILQYMVDKKIIKRVNDIYIEKYIKVNNKM